MLQSLGVVLYIQHRFCHTQAPGVFITPHIGGAVKSMRARGYKFVLEQIDRYLKGEPLHNVRLHGY